MTRDEWFRSFSLEQRERIVRRGNLILPCGPEYGCDVSDCRGWLTTTDHGDFDEFDPWTPEQIAEARAYREQARA